MVSLSKTYNYEFSLNENSCDLNVFTFLLVFFFLRNIDIWAVCVTIEKFEVMRYVKLKFRDQHETGCIIEEPFVKIALINFIYKLFIISFTHMHRKF